MRQNLTGEGAARGSPGPSGPSSRARTDLIEALQAALAGEHAAVYGYGVAGARLVGADRVAAQKALDAHRSWRDELARLIRAGAAEPGPASASYALPFPVEDPGAARRLAAHMESGLTAAYADLVLAGTGTHRELGFARMQDTAVEAARWGAKSTPFPGLPERSLRPTQPPSPAPSPERS